MLKIYNIHVNLTQRESNYTLSQSAQYLKCDIQIECQQFIHDKESSKSERHFYIVKM